MNAIHCHNLTKQFCNFKAVNNISLTVEKGEIFGNMPGHGVTTADAAVIRHGGDKGDGLHGRLPENGINRQQGRYCCRFTAAFSPKAVSIFQVAFATKASGLPNIAAGG